MKLSTNVRIPVLLALLVVVPTLQAQDSKQFSREQLISAARQIIESSRYCALITLDPSGRAQARTVDPFTPEENFVVWIGTNPLTRKVAHIRRNPRVTLYYFDRESQAYVALYGFAQVVNDVNLKAKLFKDEWKTFYPEHPKGYALIKVTPEKLEVVNVKKGILGDSLKWLPPVVRFGKGKTRK